MFPSYHLVLAETLVMGNLREFRPPLPGLPDSRRNPRKNKGFRPVPTGGPKGQPVPLRNRDRVSGRGNRSPGPEGAAIRSGPWTSWPGTGGPGQSRAIQVSPDRPGSPETLKLARMAGDWPWTARSASPGLRRRHPGLPTRNWHPAEAARTSMASLQPHRDAKSPTGRRDPGPASRAAHARAPGTPATKPGMPDGNKDILQTDERDSNVVTQESRKHRRRARNGHQCCHGRYEGDDQ